MPATPTDDTPPATGGLAAQLAPFVAWMATQLLDEPTRRRYRVAVEDYLRWRRGDPGPSSNRRRRYEHQLTRGAPIQLADTHAGLALYADYQQLCAHTLPIDH